MQIIARSKSSVNTFKSRMVNKRRIIPAAKFNKRVEIVLNQAWRMLNDKDIKN